LNAELGCAAEERVNKERFKLKSMDKTRWQQTDFWMFDWVAFRVFSENALKCFLKLLNTDVNILKLVGTGTYIKYTFLKR
jgi:hypothetical protein